LIAAFWEVSWSLLFKTVIRGQTIKLIFPLQKSSLQTPIVHKWIREIPPELQKINPDQLLTAHKINQNKIKLPMNRSCHNAAVKNMTKALSGRFLCI